jgi:hypothetical protein
MGIGTDCRRLCCIEIRKAVGRAIALEMLRPKFDQL